MAYEADAMLVHCVRSESGFAICNGGPWDCSRHDSIWRYVGACEERVVG